MSALEVRILICDGVNDDAVCDARYGGDPCDDTVTSTYSTLRSDAKTLNGWAHVNGRDYCPDHAAQARAAVGDVDASVAALRALLAPTDRSHRP